MKRLVLTLLDVLLTRARSGGAAPEIADSARALRAITVRVRV
jgi:hypothetical protein